MSQPCRDLKQNTTHVVMANLKTCAARVQAKLNKVTGVAA